MIRVLPAILLGIMISFSAPNLAFAETSTCEASWYGPGFHGKRMANGNRFDRNDPTVVAHKSFAFGTVLNVVNKRNGRSIRVKVQDRGPYAKGRCLDFSEAGAAALGFKNRGHTEVEFTIVR